jgi:hypothetical protein
MLVSCHLRGVPKNVSSRIELFHFAAQRTKQSFLKLTSQPAAESEAPD